MRQLVILSGKGGTGKTTIAGAFIRLSQAKAYADCDVDAPNLHLITAHGAPNKTDNYYGLPKANIDPARCIACDVCRQHCRFGAISEEPYTVDLFACEGCGLCARLCPVGAASMVPHVAGELMLYQDEQKTFSTAQLHMGSGTSGLLVTEVKNRLKTAADNAPFAVIDGSPGIGCPVIASLSGVDMVLIVAEPSLSGIHDMKRIVDTAANFGVQTALCINKYDTNLSKAEEIEAFCKEHHLAFTGKIPFDPMAVTAANDGKTVTDIDCPAGNAVKAVYENTMNLFFSENKPNENPS